MTPATACLPGRGMVLQRRPRVPLPGALGRVERIAVFRALMLGDMLCAVPALRALRHAFPGAEITLVGLPWARTLAQRLPYVDRCIDFPGHPGLPETPCDVRQLPDFLAQVQAQRFDLALQLHGSGTIANPLVASFGAETTAGFRGRGAWVPEEDAPFYAPWPEHGHETERLLALTDWLGLPRRGTHLEFPVSAADRSELAALWPGAQGPRPYVCLHAGAQLPSRRWPFERFAQVADRLAAQGRTVVLTGGAPEAELGRALESCMATAPVNLVGRTSLWTLGALIERCERVVCNDTGLSHIAAALRRPSVVISSGADVARWAPPDRQRHTVLWHDMPCRPCGHAVCPERHGCAEAIDVEAVMRAVDAPTPEAPSAPSTSPQACGSDSPGTRQSSGLSCVQAHPPQGGAAGGPAKPDPRQPLGCAGSSIARSAMDD
jgi:lipopolysaccharide heptosyltransferase II